MPSPRHPYGMSAMVRVKNERHTIEASLLSLADLVDEYIVVDASDDGTTDIIRDLAHSQGLPLTLVVSEEHVGRPMTTTAQYAEENQRALDLCGRRWILRWDGDFVARRSGPWSFERLLERLRDLDPRRYYMIEYPHVRLAGDLAHTARGNRLHREGWIWTNSDRLRYYDAGRFEGLHVPWYYARLKWGAPYSFHLQDLKPDRRLLLRHYWTDWREAADFQRWPTVEDYARERAKETWGVDRLEDAAQKYMADYLHRLVPYSSEDLGPLPEAVKRLAASPPFEVRLEERRRISHPQSRPSARAATSH